MILNLKIAKKDEIIINFKIKMYIVVVIHDVTFENEIVDGNDEIETKTKKTKKNKIETNIENFVDRSFDQLHQN